MSAVYQELNPKGLEVVLGAVNANPRVPDFIRQFNTPFRVGVADEMKARDFMQISVMVPAYVPWLVIIDRQGVIRYQHFGNDPFFDDGAKSTRAEAGKLLSERPTPAPAAKKK